MYFTILGKKDMILFVYKTFILLQKLCSYVNAEWGYDAFINPNTSNSRGVMILFQNTFEQKVHNKSLDTKYEGSQEQRSEGMVII